MRVYVFIDAESHFIRSENAVKNVIGSPKGAKALALAGAEMNSVDLNRFPGHLNDSQFVYQPDLQLFWDTHWVSRVIVARNAADRNVIARAVYACSITGTEDKAHAARVQLRDYGFDPEVVSEPKDLKKRREDKREEYALIEKPKGCDIAIATRMVADAAANLYDGCVLFTSDADFIPAVEAVRRMGKVVWVFGYKGGLGKRSPYLYVPDYFVDLEDELRGVWSSYHEVITKSLEDLGEKGPFNPWNKQ